MTICRIRTAEPADAPAIAELSAQLGYDSPVARMEHRLNAISTSDDHAVFVARAAEGPVVGWVHVFQTMRVESESFSELGGFVVAKTCRGQGIGRLLLAAAEGWAIGRDVGVLRVRSRTARAGAHAFYEHMGFAPVKEQHVLDKTLGPDDRS